jgi:PAS domain S-box-containing protein
VKNHDEKMNKNLKILIIDDDEVDRMMVKRAIKGTGLEHTITESNDANSGIINLKENDYDCVFLDYLLPGTDGLILLNKVRAEGIKTPVVIITSQGDEKIAVEMMKSGASDYIIKTQINTNEIAKVLRNVTRLHEIEHKREQAETALKISESRLAEAQKIAKIGNWEFDLKNEKLYWSEEMYVIFETDPSILVLSGQSFIKCFYQEDQPIVGQTLSNVMNGNPFNIDVRILTSVGSLKFVNLQGYSISNRKEEKIIGTVQDVTDRKLVEQELIIARQVAEELIKVKEQFLAHMSHEIRTPMNAIIGFTKLLLQQQNQFSPEQIKYIGAIYHSGENLMVIINDILDFSKINSGKMTLERTNFSISNVIVPLIDLLQPKAQEKNIEIIYSIDPTTPETFIGDPVRINQILVNLLGNALKFTDKGFIRLIVKPIIKEEKNTLIEFTVEDTGIGIPEDKRKSIFESFTQASSDTTRKYGGTGLGLTIVKSLVEMQNGSIEVTSTEGIGTRFKVRLPLENSDKKQEDHFPKKDKSHKTFSSLEGIKILLVEDNELNQFLAKTVLNNVGCLVEIAQNGIIALDKLKENVFNIILMDLQMPEMDGYETTQYIRTKFEKTVRNIPIIAMTAHALQSELERCLKAGMNDYITKPFENEVLYQKILSLVDKTSNHLEINNKPYLNDPENSDSKKLFNLEYLYYSFPDNRKYVKELLGMFIRDVPTELDKLKNFNTIKEWENVRKQSHKLKSSYGLIGSRILQENMRQVELNCANNEIDEEKFSSIINITTILTSHLISELKTEIGTSD